MPTWAELHRPRTGTCQRCGQTPPRKRHAPTELVSISGERRRTVDDYVELCVSCHRREAMTQEVRQRIGDSLRGRSVSTETRERLRAATLRRWQTPQTKGPL